MSRTLMYVAAVVTCLGVTMAAGSAASQDRPPKKYTETITTKDGEKVSFGMVLIPSGSFLMGSPVGRPGRGKK